MALTPAHTTQPGTTWQHSAPQCPDSAPTKLQTVPATRAPKPCKYCGYGHRSGKGINKKPRIQNFYRFVLLLPESLVFSMFLTSEHCFEHCQSTVRARQNPAPPHHFTLEGSHSNPRAPSFNVGATPLRRWCRILDLQLVFVFSLWWPQC